VSRQGACSAPPAILSLKEAEKAARRALRLEAELRKLKAAIRAWVEANGPVAADGREFRIEEVRDYEWDVPRVLLEIRMRGLDPADFIDISRRGEERILSDPGFRAVLEGAFREKVVRRLVVRAAGGA